MKIRHISLEDAEQFAHLLVSVDASNMMLFEPSERRTSQDQEEKRIEEILLQSNSTILVAEEDNRLVGYLIILGGQNIRNKHSAHIVIGILENYRGQGIGVKLFDEAFRWAESKELTRLSLTAMKHNERAIKLYKKMGFQIEGEKIHSLIVNGQPVDEVYLYKLLGAD